MRFRLLVSAPVPFLLFSCAAEPLLPSDSGELADRLEHELAARAEIVAAARAVSGDPWELWAACLETSAPVVLAARRDLALLKARAREQGAPQTMLDVEHVGSGSERETELMLALDLPGLVGAGRAGAARARAEVDAARGEAALAATRFRAQHDLERALASLAVARELERELDAVVEQSKTNARRLDLLAGRGWLAPDQVASAHTMLHHLSAMRAEREGAVAGARARVARVSGLPVGSPWLDDDATTGLALVRKRMEGRAARPDPDDRALLDSLPELTLARFDYLASEADLRAACAQQWPALLIGPKAVLTPDDLLWGGVLRLELPWPPSASAAVDSARAGRERARDALVSALAAAQVTLRQRRSEERSAELGLREHGLEVALSSEQVLRAAQARFAVDAAALLEWSMAVDQRARALAARADALERWLAATFDLSEAIGA